MSFKPGTTFLLNRYVKNGSYNVWMTLLGDDKVASNFQYSITARMYMGGKNLEYSWKFPVLPYHDGPEYLEKTGLYCTFPYHQLAQNVRDAEGKIPIIKFKVELI